MRPWVTLTLASISIAMLSGCTGTNRSPLFSPFQPLHYGQQCVAPPATGTIGYNQYNQPRAFTAAVPQTGFSTQRQMQPVPQTVPQLSRPTGVTQPRTSSVPVSDEWETTKSANAPSPNSSAGIQQSQPTLATRTTPVNDQRLATTRGLTADENLAWTPPFGGNRGFSTVSQQSFPQVPQQSFPQQQRFAQQQATYVAPAANYNPIRPSVVRPTSFGGPVISNQVYSEDCNCYVTAAPGVPIPQGSYPTGSYDSGPVYTAVDSSRWQPRR